MNQQQASYPDLLALARTMSAEGCDIEDILDALRAKSPSIIQSMKVLRDVLGVPMDEAKQLVHHSRAWSDMRDEHSELHERAEAANDNEVTQREDGSLRVDIDLTEQR